MITCKIVGTLMFGEDKRNGKGVERVKRKKCGRVVGWPRNECGRPSAILPCLWNKIPGGVAKLISRRRILIMILLERIE